VSLEGITNPQDRYRRGSGRGSLLIGCVNTQTVIHEAEERRSNHLV